MDEQAKKNPGFRRRYAQNVWLQLPAKTINQAAAKPPGSYRLILYYCTDTVSVYNLSMESRSANLVIMFTDIVGFTTATAKQSRQQNETLISTHDALLLPLIDSFRGEHIKSIGDSLLCVFQSPTDALLCSMALQDQLYAHNQGLPEADRINIRIALNLGEVRVAKGDIFGDAVNITSRIEGITPRDEIYFSEAVYMTMNKAEVAAQDLGLHELPGSPEQLRLYRIPRFATTELTANADSSTADIPVAYPFGGAHLHIPDKPRSRSATRLQYFDWRVAVVAAVVAVLFGVFVLTGDVADNELTDSKTPRRQRIQRPAEVPAKAAGPPAAMRRPLPQRLREGAGRRMPRPLKMPPARGGAQRPMDRSRRAGPSGR